VLFCELLIYCKAVVEDSSIVMILSVLVSLVITDMYFVFLFFLDPGNRSVIGSNILPVPLLSPPNMDPNMELKKPPSQSSDAGSTDSSLVVFLSSSSLKNSSVGLSLGVSLSTGDDVGLLDGLTVGFDDGFDDGFEDGLDDTVGFCDGDSDGTFVGIGEFVGI